MSWISESITSARDKSWAWFESHAHSKHAPDLIGRGWEEHFSTGDHFFKVQRGQAGGALDVLGQG